MPNLPWDLLAGRLGRYLQLSYRSAVLAGFCLTGEIFIHPVLARGWHGTSSLSGKFKGCSDLRRTVPGLRLLVRPGPPTYTWQR